LTGHNSTTVDEQKRVADELDQASRNGLQNLQQANEVLRKEVADAGARRTHCKRSEAFLPKANVSVEWAVFPWPIGHGRNHVSEELYRIFEFDCDAAGMLEQIVVESTRKTSPCCL